MTEPAAPVIRIRIACRRPRQRALGGVYAFTAYVLWGFLPLYFLLLAPTGPLEVVAWRILLSLVFCAILLTVTRTWRALVAIMRQPRLLLLTARRRRPDLRQLAGVPDRRRSPVTSSRRASATSSTRSSRCCSASSCCASGCAPTQWVAIGIAALAVVVIVVGYGAFPWIALSLAVSFGVYGLVKKQVGPSVDAVSGLTLETLWLDAGRRRAARRSSRATTRPHDRAPRASATRCCCLAGVITATPLLLLRRRRAPRAADLVGLLQFLAPILQFIIGVWLLGEPMPLERWIGFALVWVALIVLTVDSLVAARRSRAAVGRRWCDGDWR